LSIASPIYEGNLPRSERTGYVGQICNLIPRYAISCQLLEAICDNGTNFRGIFAHFVAQAGANIESLFVRMSWSADLNGQDKCGELDLAGCHFAFEGAGYILIPAPSCSVPSDNGICVIEGLQEYELTNHAGEYVDPL
jgi:hypothetical protein